MKRWLISETTVAAANRLSAAFERPLRRLYLALIAAMWILPFAFLFAGLHPACAPVISVAVFGATTMSIALTWTPHHEVNVTADEFAGLRRVWLSPVMIQVLIAGAGWYFPFQMARREVALLVGLVNVWSFTVAIAFAYALNVKLMAKRQTSHPQA